MTHWKKLQEEIQPMGTKANQDVLANSQGSLARKKQGSTQSSYQGPKLNTLPGSTTGAPKRDSFASSKQTPLGQWHLK